MKRMALVGLDAEKESILTRLMDLGAVEIADQSAKLAEDVWRDATGPDGAPEEVARIEALMNRADLALTVLERYDRSKKPLLNRLFHPRRPMSAGEAAEADGRLEDGAQKTDEVLALYEQMQAANETLNKLETERLSVTPWQPYDLPLDLTGTDKTRLQLGVLPMGSDLAAITGAVEEASAGEAAWQTVGSDKDMYYIAVLTTADRFEAVGQTLKNYSFTQVSFPAGTGTAAEALQRMAGTREEMTKRVAELEAAISQKAGYRADIEVYYDMLSIRVDKVRVRSRLLQTKNTFFAEGWVPARCLSKVEEALAGSDCYYAFRDPEEDEQVPVALDNPNFFVPFEAITEMYSLPDYRGFDPTSLFAIFYAIFFGMMLSDAGYGIILTVACFIILKKIHLEGTTYKMIKMFFYCGISTIFWGAMFGGWFGDIVAVFSRSFLGHEVVLPPLWFNPIDDPMKLLIFSLALGIIHIFLGMGIKAYMQIREGHWWDAVCDEGFWYLTILGLIGWLGGGSVAPAIVPVCRVMAIAGLLGLLLTGGRHNKGFGKVTGGLSNVYDITSYLSDILSYARILALGLATGVIAQVVNQLGSMIGSGVVGIIAFVAIFLIGHVFNLAINALGAFIHSSRLQYIEFFGKFYEDGGEPFDPLRRRTRYVRIE